MVVLLCRHESQPSPIPQLRDRWYRNMGWSDLLAHVMVVMKMIVMMRMWWWWYDNGGSVDYDGGGGNDNDVGDDAADAADAVVMEFAKQFANKSGTSSVGLSWIMCPLLNQCMGTEGSGLLCRYYYAHLIDEKINVWKGLKWLPKVTWLGTLSKLDFKPRAV